MIIDAFIKTQAAVLSDTIVQLRSTITSEHIHRLRVATKKLRTVARLLGDPSVMDPVLEIYRASGTVREPEIMGGVLGVFVRDTTIDAQPLHRLLTTQRNAAIKQLKVVVAQTDDATIGRCLKKLRDLRSHFTDAEIERMIDQRIKRKRKRACKAADALSNIDVLHAMRKDLKQVNHLMMIDENAQDMKGKHRRAIISDIESFAGAIHDRAMLQEWLRSVPSDVISRRMRDSIITSLTKHMETELRQMKSSLHAMCSTAS